ncbi:MAG: hypothetical protein AABX16_01855 [Nanoarchaeota archaeon]
MSHNNLEHFLNSYIDGENPPPLKEKTPYGHWRNVKNIVKEARRIKKIHKLDSLPGAKRLTELGYGYLAGVINKYVGMRSLRTFLGEEQKELPKGAWKNKDFIIEEAKRVMKENYFSSMPGNYVLSKMGYSSLAAAIDKEIGFKQLRKMFGEKQVNREAGVWKDKTYVIKEARKIKRKHKLKKLPGNEILKQLGYHGFLNGIQKYHGGINAVREYLGEETVRIDSQLLRNQDYILQQAQKIMQKEGFDSLPGSTTLYAKGYSSFVNAVNRHHEGITTIRKKLGQKEIKKQSGFWEKWKNAQPILKKLNKELGHFPTQRDLQREGYGTLANVITHKYGGINAVRERMGVETERKDKGYYHDPKNIENETQQILQQNPQLKGVLPSAYWLQKNGHGALCAGIQKTYGSYKLFREQKGLPKDIQVESGKWKNLEFTLQQAKKFMDKQGLEEFPGSLTLSKCGHSSLGAAIEKYHGGLPLFREKLYEYIGKSQVQTSQLESFLQEYTKE